MRTAKLLHVIAASALVLCSCGKQPLPDTVPSSPVNVSFTAGTATKAAADASGEDSVMSLDALVFMHSGGALAASGRSSGSSLTLQVPCGEQVDWYLVGNAPAGMFSSVSDEDDFLSLPLPLSANSAGALVMMGHGTETFDSDGGVNCVLTRYVSRVSFGRFTPEFQDGTREVTFERAYLLNVCGRQPMSMVPSVPDLWYNALAADPELREPVRGFLGEDIGAALTSAAPVTGEHVFYCLPNPVENGISTADVPEWSPRGTRLVLEFTVDGQRRYYPVTLPAMQSGYHYRIGGIVLRSAGSSHPDVPVERDAASVTVTVAPWGENDIDIDY